MNMKSKHKLYEKILNGLLEIVYLYKRSTYYSYIPDCKEDGWEYFTHMFNTIDRQLNGNLTLSQAEYAKIKTIICEIKSFTRSFSGADGLTERYFDANPNLRYFRVAFGIQETNDGLFYSVAAMNMIAYIPKIKDFNEKNMYFEQMNKNNVINNFRENEDDYLMTELALALRQVFLTELYACN